MARVASYYLPAGVIREQLGGIDFYRFLKDLLAHYDERADEVAEHLTALARRLFVDEGCTVSFAGSDEDFERFWSAGAGTGRPGSPELPLSVPEPVIRNEAFVVPSDVCYAAQGFDRRAIGAPYTGAWQVAARALSYDYLWNEVRVKGGAYGAGFGAARTGNMRFYSYRDPHLDETLARFAESAAWLASFEPRTEEMEGYVVATVAGFDAAPEGPSAREAPRRRLVCPGARPRHATLPAARCFPPRPKKFGPWLSPSRWPSSEMQCAPSAARISSRNRVPDSTL